MTSSLDKSVDPDAPVKPGTSRGLYPTVGWSDDEKQKLRQAKSVMLGGLKECGTSFAWVVAFFGVSAWDAATAVVPKALLQWAGTAGGGAGGSKGLWDMYHGLMTWREITAAHNKRLLTEYEAAKEAYDLEAGQAGSDTDDDEPPEMPAPVAPELVAAVGAGLPALRVFAESLDAELSRLATEGEGEGEPEGGEQP
jgi:hypothetical protein